MHQSNSKKLYINVLLLPLMAKSLINISMAAPLELGLFERSTTSPINALITFDNSGSMLNEINSEILWAPSNYQRELATPHVAKIDSIAPQRVQRQPPSCLGPNKYSSIKFLFGDDREYIDTVINTANSSLSGCRNLTLKHFPEMYAVDWRPFSSSGNALYYNPERQYNPWPGYPQANFRSVRLSPQAGNVNYDNTIDLATVEFYPNKGFHFNIWQDTAGYDGPAPTPRNYKNQANQEIDLWDSHTEYRVTATQIEITQVTYNPNPASNLDNCDFKNANPLIGYERCLGRETKTISWKNNFGRSLAQEQQNIANWFQYYRNRALESRYALAKIITTYPEINFGITTLGIESQKKYFIPVRDQATSPLEHEQALTSALFTNWEYIGGTPLAASALFAGDYFQSGIGDHPSPIQTECDQNLHIMMTDGARNSDWSITRPEIIDHDKDGERYHKSSTAISLADIASYFYNTDLAPNLPNSVSSTPALCNGIPAVAHQALVSIFFNYGPSADEFQPDQCWPPGQLKTNDHWGPAFPEGESNSNEMSYLDLWHAAYNSRGFFSFFNQAQALIDRLSLYIQKSVIQGEYTGPTALSRNDVSEDTLFFASSFDLNSNTASIKAYRYNATLPLEQLNRVWSTTDLNSNIKPALISYDQVKKAGVEIGSNYGSNGITNSQATLLFPTVKGPLTAEKNALMNRIFTTPLGPVVHSNLLYVGNPSARQQFKGNQINTSVYSKKFVDFTQLTRRAMLYFNSTDGKLYGLDAETGQEVLTYIPSPVLKSDFANQDTSQFTPFLNGKNAIADAYLESKNRWGTVLIGSMRQGGQGFFALDITNPDSFNADKVLWEFTDQNDSDLGYTYAKPALGVFENEKHYAVLSNGYNSTAAATQDQIQSSTGQAVLYVLNVSTGELVAKLNTGIGAAQDPLGLNRPNGFAEPALVDSDRNGLVDTLYVGDFFGNLYAFDVSDDSAQNWKSAFGTSAAPLPMVSGAVVNHQPITSRPAVTRNSTSDELLIIFGTGENITKTPNQQPNFLIAAKHTATPITSRAEMLERTLSKSAQNQWSIEEPLETTGATADDIKLDAKKGWYFELQEDAAKFNITEQPILRYGQLIWSIAEYKQPTSQTSCNQTPDQNSHIIAMNPFSGLSLTEGIFPNSQNEALTNNERTVDGLTINAQINNLEIISLEDKEIMLGSGFGAGTITLPKMQIKNLKGRQSWRRL